jgi:RNA polymerase sigma-70 factor (ECF subfamily)
MPWLMTITANRCRTALGRRTRTPAPTDFPIEVLVGPLGNVLGESTEMAEELARALDELREDYRECFILFYQQEHNCAEIGELLGCPIGTVKTWLHRARQQLAGTLRRRGFAADFSETQRPTTG